MTVSKSKALLAKLMATENIYVEQRNVTTASFNTQTRVLTVPTLDKDISDELYDLFFGHEVGHALWTEMTMLRQAEKLNISQGVVNVVEDARIERMIKNKYPGLRNSFATGYRELMEKDFFGIKDKTTDHMSFIDRINIYYKCGGFTPVKFTEEERVFIKMIDDSRTCSEILETCVKLTEYIKQKSKEAAEKVKNLCEKFGKLEKVEPEDVEGGEYQDEPEDDARKVKADNTEPADNVDDKLEEKSGNGPGTGHQGQEQETQENEEIRSHTDEALEKNREKLYSDDKRTYRYVNIPKVDLDHMVVDYKDIWKRYRKDMITAEATWGYKNRTEGADRPGYTKLRTESQQVVSYLAKEFELKKNAEQSKRASVSKTGELDMNKVFSYQLNDDIFRRVTTIPGGKNHGLVIIMDWSGSMVKHLEDTVKQLISLVLFCRKVSIPFEVYAFTTQYFSEKNRVYGYKPERKPGDLIMNDCILMNILSCRMSNNELTYAGASLLRCSKHPRHIPDWMGLSGTPLNEAVIGAMEIVPKFQKEYKLQVVNTVFLTDGDGACLYESYDSNGFQIREPFNYLIIRDPVTKNEIELKSYYSSKENGAAFVKLLKMRADCNVVGFYILDGRSWSSSVHWLR